jgi:uncharacterized protein
VTPDLDAARRFLAALGPPGVLAVGVTGAHYYGFPSPDSDLDLKGVHVGDTGEVVSLRPPPDAIDYLGVFEGMDIDYTSHELAVTLRLLLKGNGNILERILSPFQVIDTEAATELQALARGGVSKKFFHHYRGFFVRKFQDWRAAEPRTVKGLLYAYRSALTGIHLLRTGECIGDVTRLAPIYGFERVEDLVALKRRSSERSALGATEGYDADLERLETLLLAAHSESPLPPESPNAEALNGFLVRVRRAHFA